MIEPLPPEILNKLLHARELDGRTRENIFVSPTTVPETLAFQAKHQPMERFLTYLPEGGGERRYNYGDFYDHVRCLASFFKSHGVITRGDRIATAMHNHDLSILTCFAAWHLGAVVVPLNMSEDDKRLAYILQHANVKALAVLPEYAERMRPLWKDSKIKNFFLAGPAAQTKPGEHSIEEYLKHTNAPSLPVVRALQSNDEALIVYTSGTTGVPKGVVLSHYELIADAYSIARWHGFDTTTKLMCVLPVHHVNGLEVTHVTTVFCGASVVLARKFSASQFFETVRTQGIQVVSVVPTLLQFLLEAHPDGADKGTLRYVICGAGPLTVDLATRFEERFGVPVVHGYGLSETTCYSCFVPIPKDAALPGAVTCEKDEYHRWMRDYGYPSIGREVETNSMAIHDEQGQPVEEGVKGEIVIRGHNVMLGYYDNLKANEGAFTHGWFRSGDEGFFKRDAEGRAYFFICGRFKELIVRGGVKISPLEVDEIINGVPGVKSGMAVGFDHTTFGEEVGAYIVKQPDATLTEEDVLAACRAKLPAWMAPKAVVFGETFPVTSTGKYQRNQLKPLFEQYKDAQFRG